MKICAECQFSQAQAVQVGPEARQIQVMKVCLNESCRDPVEGTPLPCQTARQSPAFCGLAANFFQKKKDLQPEVKLIQT